MNEYKTNTTTFVSIHFVIQEQKQEEHALLVPRKGNCTLKNSEDVKKICVSGSNRSLPISEQETINKNHHHLCQLYNSVK